MVYTIIIIIIIYEDIRIVKDSCQLRIVTVIVTSVTLDTFSNLFRVFLQVVEKELLIQEKEKLYMELKQILARQPGPEVAEQLSIYQQTLKGKTKQMKGMASELNMYEAQVKEYKYEIERLAKELQEAKKKYYMQKRKEQQTK